MSATPARSFAPARRAAVLVTMLVLSALPPFTPPAGAVDAAAPTNPRITNTLATFQKTRAVALRWSATDDTAVVSYDVRQRRVAYTGTVLGSAATFVSASAATSASFTGAPGNTYCFSVRARDAAGNVSAFGVERCTHIPGNNTLFARRSFTNGTASGHYLNTFSKATARGATLTRTGVRARSLALIATMCRGCGTVDVFLGSTKLKRLSLAATSTKKNQALPVASFTSLRSGTLKVAVVTSGKPVLIEGFGASNTQSMIAVTGRVIDDDGAPIQGATVVGAAQPATRLPAPSRAAARRATREVNARRSSRAAGGRALAASAADGTFSISVGPQLLPAEVLVTVTIGGAVPREMAKWGSAPTSALAIGDIVLPSLAGAEIEVEGGEGGTADGSVQVENLPAQIQTLYATTYDPDDATGNDAFPGDFTEGGSIPLNSSGFTWIQGLDASGNPVHELGQATTMRSKIPPSQWLDIEDLTEGNDQIDIPIYDFDTDTNTWERHATDGWVENAAGSKLPEDNVPLIRGGTYSGDIFAVYETTHFSYMNVDYPYIGPWTLSRMPYAQRQNSCLYNAMVLAKKIALSAAGRAAYQRYNVDGADLAVELADGRGPELRTISNEDSRVDGVPSWGLYFSEARTWPPGGTTMYKDDEFAMNARIWEACGNSATATQEKNVTLMMAVTILHETAHWKWNIKHENGNRVNAEPGGEAGEAIEKALFGGVLSGGLGTGGQIMRDGAPVTDAQRDAWMNPSSWPATAPSGAPGSRAVAAPSPVSLSIATVDGTTTFPLGAEIEVDVTITNTSAAPVKVLNLDTLEGYPVWFDLVKDGARVPFLRPSPNIELTDAMFTTLAPAGTLTNRYSLLRDAAGATLYNLVSSGAYTLQAHYSPVWFAGEVEQPSSNTLNLTISPGGAISGNVKDATTNANIANASVQLKQGDVVVASTTTNGSGNYTFPDLAAASDYTMVARGPSYIRQTKTPIAVTTGNTTTVNFLLSPLLADGEVRFVLRWGANPRDLDSHLWLPAATPFEVAYYRRGDLTRCPYAKLDQDVTSGHGPETVTLSDTFPGVYSYAIYHYSGSGDFTTSGATVDVFDSSGLIATIPAPTTGSGRWWNVLTYNSATGAIDETVSALVASDPGPYGAGATAGCVPVVTSFTPASGVVGDSIQITGDNLLGTSSVRFNGVSAPFTVNSDTQITATVPCGAVGGAVSAVGSYGTGTSSGTFTPTAPTISSFTPATGPSGTSVQITGTNLGGACRVQFGGVTASSFTVDSPTQITATVPNGAPTGQVGVRAAGDTLSGDTFTVPAPQITSFTPTEGPAGTSVVITGMDLSGATAVRFNGVNAATYTVNSNTQITATVPAGNANGAVTVVTGGGTATSSGSFTVSAPQVTSFTPTEGPKNTLVTITGTNLSGASQVRFGSVNASIASTSATQVQAYVPAGFGPSGTISVTTGGGTATSADTFTVPAPTITSFTPTCGSNWTWVTITGTNLTGPSAVTFNGTSSPAFYENSTTTMYAYSPSGAFSSGAIAVTTGGGTATSADTFTTPCP